MTRCYSFGICCRTEDAFTAGNSHHMQLVTLVRIFFKRRRLPFYGWMDLGFVMIRCSTNLQVYYWSGGCLAGTPMFVKSLPMSRTFRCFYFSWILQQILLFCDESSNISRSHQGRILRFLAQASRRGYRGFIPGTSWCACIDPWHGLLESWVFAKWCSMFLIAMDDIWWHGHTWTICLDHVFFAKLIAIWRCLRLLSAKSTKSSQRAVGWDFAFHSLVLFRSLTLKERALRYSTI